MTDNETLMRTYGEASDISNRFLFLFLGILGFFFPGWYVHTQMRIYAAGLEDENFKTMLRHTQKIDTKKP